MTLQTDLLKHTIFLQRYASQERNRLIENIKKIAENALLYAHPFTTTTIRRQQISKFAKKVESESTPLLDIYSYERRFIKRLLRKYL